MYELSNTNLEIATIDCAAAILTGRSSDDIMRKFKVIMVSEIYAQFLVQH